MNYDEIYSSLAQYIDSHISNFSNSSYSLINHQQQETYKCDFKKLLYHNYRCEKDVEKLTDEIKKNVFDYLSQLDFHEPPDLYKLNKLMKINDGLRTIPVYVSVNDHMLDAFDRHFKCNHLGMNPDDLKKIERNNYLQNMIDEFYKSLDENITLNDIVKGFYYYIKFELIHPFYDGNGRLGRLIFLEHPFNYNMFPFSEILDKLSINQQSLLFKCCKLPYDGKNKQKYNIDDYLQCETKIDDKTKLNILKIIYKVVCYKQFYNINEKYAGKITAIMKTKIDNLYDKFKNNKSNCYDYDTILTVICPDVHDELM